MWTLECGSDMKIHSLQWELPTVALVSKPFIQPDAHKCYYHQFRHLLNQSPLEWTTQRLHSCPVYCPTVGISSATFAVHLAYAEILMLLRMCPSHIALHHTAMQFDIAWQGRSLLHETADCHEQNPWCSTMPFTVRWGLSPLRKAWVTLSNVLQTWNCRLPWPKASIVCTCDAASCSSSGQKLCSLILKYDQQYILQLQHTHYTGAVHFHECAQMPHEYAQISHE